MLSKAMVEPVYFQVRTARSQLGRQLGTWHIQCDERMQSKSRIAFCGQTFPPDQVTSVKPITLVGQKPLCGRCERYFQLHERRQAERAK